LSWETPAKNALRRHVHSSVTNSPVRRFVT
jgi:hypothetical protein